MPGAAATPIGRLPIHTTEERRALLACSNDTDVDYGASGLLHHAFEAVAARTPDAPAVVVGDEVVSYGALDRRANQLAQLPRAARGAARQRVAVCLERSVDMVVSLLAILKAGCAYVPIDPEYPADRLAFMLEDAAAPIVLTSRAASRATRRHAQPGGRARRGRRRDRRACPSRGPPRSSAPATRPT